MDALGKHHALGMGTGGVVELAGHLRLQSEHLAQMVLVAFPVGDGLAGHATVDGGLGNGSRHLGDEPWVDGLRNEVRRTERQVVHLVHVVHHVGNGLLGQVGDGKHGGHLHLFVDGAGMHVEGAAEDVGEANHVVDLVGIVGTPGGHQHVGTGVHGVLVGYLGHGVGQGEDNGRIGHRAHHVLRQHVALREPHEDVGAADSLLQGVHVAAVGGEEALLLVQVLAVAADHTLRVEHQDVLLLRAKGHVELRARDGGGTGAVHHDAHLRDVLAIHLQGILQSGGRDDGGAMLVVVHHGDVEGALQAVLYIEALGGLDVLKVDAAKGGGNPLHGLAEFLRVFLGHLDVEDVDATVNLEKQSLAFHNGLAAQRADVAQSQHGGAIADHGHKVALVSVLVGVVGVLLNLQAGKGHAWRIGQTQVGLGAVGLGGLHLYLAGAPTLVIGQCGFFRNLYHIEVYFY